MSPNANASMRGCVPQVKITNTASLRDAFCTELVKLSPPELALLDLQQSSNLRNFTLSPATACPQLATLDLSCCKNLTNVLIQSNSIRSMALQVHCAEMGFLPCSLFISRSLFFSR